VERLSRASAELVDPCPSPRFSEAVARSFSPPVPVLAAASCGALLSCPILNVVSSLPPMTLRQIQELPAETLSLELLRRMPRAGAVRRTRTLAETLRAAAPAPPPLVTTVTYDVDVLGANPAATLALAEGWQRLVLDGLIVDWPPTDPQYPNNGRGDVFQLTRWGHQVRAQGERGGALLSARRRLGVELHPQIATRVRDAVAVGAFEQAAIIALRAIEARVRDLVGDPRGRRGDRLTGTALMQHAFASDTGPLRDREAEPGERVGVMNLFTGAFGAIRNALVHTEVEWSDSVEAAEYVLLADLLMRLLDRAEQQASDRMPQE
jgi:uncharacterized protein (TIGR02391 family)